VEHDRYRFDRVFARVGNSGLANPVARFANPEYLSSPDLADVVADPLDAKTIPTTRQKIFGPEPLIDAVQDAQRRIARVSSQQWV
jgi:hypothetical protein